jgi:hypothetical protein
MKRINITYWTTAVLLALLSMAAAYGYITQIEMQEMMRHLGFPPFFRVELAVAKLIGAICLLAPAGARWKERTYTGFAIIYISAFIAHTSMSDPLLMSLFPVLALTLLAVSYYCHRKREAYGLRRTYGHSNK